MNIPKDVLQSIQELVDYSYNDEAKNFMEYVLSEYDLDESEQEQVAEELAKNPNIDGHIFKDILKVSEWLETYAKKSKSKK